MTTVHASAEATSRSPRRVPVLVVLGMLMVLVVISVLSRKDTPFGQAMDPRNPRPEGTKAVAQVLEQHGVDVRIVRGQAAFLETPVDPGTTVVVTNPSELGASTVARLRDHAAGAGALVIVGGATELADRFGGDTASSFSGRRAAACDEELTRGLVVRTYGGRGLASPGCFGSSAAAVLVHRDDLWLVASPRSFANEHVQDSDNAALALRLLGQQPRLVWYVAAPDDTLATDGVELSSLMPGWLVPGLYLLLSSVLALVLWRGRRLGPLVTEPLPVVVRAAESTQSRGRIYRRTGDRAHAATILVAATRRRLAESLQLPRGTSLQTLAGTAATRTGRDPRAVFDLLAGPAVTKDSQLVELGQQLLQLENEVRTP